VHLLDAVAPQDNWFTIALAALNVVQTIALAYLAARAHVDR
jgi:hypothetical protein